MSSQGVLVAEDQAEIRELVAMIFSTSGFDVHQAGDGEEALAVFSAHAGEIALVVTDLGLPKLGGVELIAKIRALSPTVKIIAASGYGTGNVRSQVIEAGANEFVAKPFAGPQLLETARRLMQSPEHRTKS